MLPARGGAVAHRLLTKGYDAGQFGARDLGLAMACAMACAIACKSPPAPHAASRPAGNGYVRFGADLAASEFDAALQAGAQPAAASCPSNPACHQPVISVCYRFYIPVLKTITKRVPPCP